MTMANGQGRAKSPTKLRGARMARYAWGYFFVAPWIVGFLIFTAYPMVYSAIISFTKFDLLSSPEYIGLGNFRRMVNDDLFLISLGNTAYYTFLSVPITIALALGMALALNQNLRGINIFRTMLIFLAGLQSVPEALLEAAAIDGAGPLRRFWHVTVPMITPVIFFNVVLGIIGSFQIFTTAFIATGGGPVNSTLFYVLWIYRHAFENFRMGYAATLAWVLLAIILVFTLIQFYLARKWVYYEGGST